MKNRSKKFFNDYEFMQYEINLQNDIDFDFLTGTMTFFYYDESDSQKIIAEVLFTIFNSFEMDYFYDMADSISGDFEYVASAFNNYCEDIASIGSITIIDELIIKDEFTEIQEKISVIKNLLKLVTDAFSIIGIGIILLMTKTLILNSSANDRVLLIDGLLEIGFLPIYEDETDVVIAKNLEYI